MKYIDKVRRLLSEEQGHIIKSPEGKISVALAYPNVYRVGMSNLGFQNIYYLLNREEDVVCERVFLPDREDVDDFVKKKTPLLSLENQIPVSHFDILAFSISFERDYVNILKILDLARIPFLNNQRNSAYPLIMAGGVCTFYNPEPLADFIDLFLIGEGEELVKDLIREFRKTAETEEAKDEMLERFSAVKGVYVPSGYKVSYHSDGRIRSVEAKKGYPKKIKKRHIKDINEFPASTRIVTKNTEFSGMYLIEIERGCGRKCNFCAAGYIYDPPRFASKDIIMNCVREGLACSDKIGLVGSALMDHPSLELICREILKIGGKISVSSLRIDVLSEGLIKSLAESGHKTLSFAPEAGTERLRRAINKELTDEEIIEGIKLTIAHDILNIKLYFLIGIPTERDEDVEAIIDLAKKIKHHMLKESRKKGRIGNITLSINPFVPKPYTPFQWDGMDDIKSLERKLKMIKNGLKKVGNISIIHELPKWAFVQSLLAKGDRKVGELLLAAYHLEEDWRRVYREMNINPDFYVYRESGYDELFPWDHIDTGISKEYLIKKREKALSHGKKPQ